MNIKIYNKISLQMNTNSIPKTINNLIYIKALLIDSIRNINNFIKAINTYSKDGMGFEFINVDIDNINNLVYLSESWHDYKNKTTTQKIDQLLEEENFIELCKIGFLDHITMTKDNFIHILFTWDKLLDQQSPFALLYQDDKDWFDVKPFDTQEAMEQFVADHTQK